MTAGVVYNRADTTVSFPGGVIGAHEWRFIENLDDVSKKIERGTLVVVTKPKGRQRRHNPQMVREFERLAAFNKASSGNDPEKNTPKTKTDEPEQEDVQISDTETTSNGQAEQEG